MVQTERMSRKELVKRAIAMKSPDRLPLFFFNRNKDLSDIVMVDVVRHFMGEDKSLSEWGFRWDRSDETMGQPKEELIKDWSVLEKLTVPDPSLPGRFSGLETAKQEYGEDRYYIASLVLSGFTVMTFLRGFNATLEDLVLERSMVEKLADLVFGFENEVIRCAKGRGFDCIAFFDDWGTQQNLIISPDLWRDFFKPRYKEQFDLCHESGFDVYFHCCGYIYDIIPDFIEIGVDMLNISQPNLFDIGRLGKDLGGKVCFVCPVSYQTTSLSGSKDDIYKDVQTMVKHLGSHNGGLIGYIEEYHSIGMSEENYWHCVHAFQELGTYV